MKRIRNILTAVILLVLLFPAAVSAAGANVSVTGGTAKVGETVTITVTYRGNTLGYVNGMLSYDNSKLQYLSGGSSQGDAGLVELKSYADNAGGKLSFRIKFKAVGSGAVDLSLETLETQNLDGDQSLGTPSAGSSVQIAASQETEETETTATSEEETTESARPTQQEASSQQGPASGNTDAEEKEVHVNYPVLGGIAVVLLALIAVILMRLKKK